MALAAEGEGGLRRRLRLVTPEPYPYTLVAGILTISTETLQNYLENPEYVLTNETYATIMEHIGQVPGAEVSKRGEGDFYYILLQKPLWTERDVALLRPPIDAAKVAVTYFNPVYPDHIATHGPIDLDISTVQGVIEAAVDGDLSLLVGVIWYARYAIYPYNPS